MNIVLNGIAIGFISAVFVSIYTEGLLGYSLPIWLIYGIFAPAISALAITLLLLSGKEERKREFEMFGGEKE